jgi:hypothetical protein
MTKEEAGSFGHSVIDRGEVPVEHGRFDGGFKLFGQTYCHIDAFLENSSIPEHGRAAKPRNPCTLWRRAFKKEIAVITGRAGVIDLTVNRVRVTIMATASSRAERSADCGGFARFLALANQVPERF